MTDESATIVFHRKLSWTSAGLQLAVRVNDREAAKLRIGGTVAVDVAPGSYVVKVMYGNREVKYCNTTGPATVEAGGTRRFGSTFGQPHTPSGWS